MALLLGLFCLHGGGRPHSGLRASTEEGPRVDCPLHSLDKKGQ